MAGNVSSLLTPPTQAMGGYGAAPYAGQFNVQSMTIGELSWWSSVWKVVKKAAPVVIGMLETPMPAAGGIGQQSSGQVLQAMATGQMSAGQMTIAQMGWFSKFIKKALPIAINVGKSIFQMSEAKQGVGAASFGAMSAQGITAQEFDAAIQAIESGKFSVVNMQLNELGIFDSLIPNILKLIGSFSQVPEEPQAVGQQDLNSILQKINQVAGAVPSITDAVSQIVKLINGFRSQGIQGQSISSQSFGSWWMKWKPPILTTVPGPFVTIF